jgi:hypothetical protein
MMPSDIGEDFVELGQENGFALSPFSLVLESNHIITF